MNEKLARLLALLDRTGTGLNKYWTDPKKLSARKALIDKIIGTEIAMQKAEEVLDRAPSYFARNVAEKALNAARNNSRGAKQALASWEAKNPPLLKAPPRARTMNGLGAHCVNSDFGSGDEASSLYDLRVNYMQPALYPSETQDHLERELMEEIENVSEDDGNFYYEGDQSEDAIIDENQNSSYNSENASKITVADAVAQAQTANAPASKTNKPLLIGAAAGIAALMYFNKG